MKYLIPLVLISLSMFSCNSSTEKIDEVKVEKEISIVEEVEEEIIEIEMELDGIKVSSTNYQTAYPEARLSLNNFMGTGINPGENEFSFEVENYNLTENTDDNVTQMCANSGKGQHIHFIMDNQPYSAEYGSTVVSDVSEGHHVLLAFLARSYHMSIKNGNAHLVQEFDAGEGEYEDNFNENDPHLFYSRPKGTYTGIDAERVLLDFFLLNADLKKDAYSVRVTINEVSFDLHHWMPYVIEGLPMGTNNIKLEFLDNMGILVNSPFNPVSRTFELAAE